ncbi:hypothetical protein [Bacillus aerolatus]|uniref:hypothetical protein n=1 Tax=Bacillus aerolatus TaxID=2653354 RepID=UPI00177D03F3|nr:hypothetical protein [Bacillus aerolatus]
MDAKVQGYFDDLESKDKGIQYEAYKNILTVTKKEVDWAYEVWDQLLQDLTNRAIGKVWIRKYNQVLFYWTFCGMDLPCGMIYRR